MPPPEHHEQRPLLRGYLHLAAGIAAIAGCVLLVLLADSPRAYAGGAIFAASLILLYFTSATYHIVSWGRKMRAVLQRLDHSMIFVLIAGSYTPFALVAANGAWGISMLAVIWSIAIAGVVLKVAWPGAPRWLSVMLYVAAGWLALVYSAPLSEWITPVPFLLMLAGGLLYTLGGVIYAAKRPDPFPRFFGYHEVFHLLTVVAASLHFTVVAAYLMPA
jgi:hemolysin III